jgi:hypothetical protein
LFFVLAVDRLQRERRTDLREHDMGDEAGIAGEGVKPQHPGSILIE